MNKTINYIDHTQNKYNKREGKLLKILTNKINVRINFFKNLILENYSQKRLISLFINSGLKKKSVRQYINLTQLTQFPPDLIRRRTKYMILDGSDHSSSFGI